MSSDPQVTSICCWPTVSCDAYVLHLAHVILESLEIFLIQEVDPSHEGIIAHHLPVGPSLIMKLTIFLSKSLERGGWGGGHLT